MLTVFQVVMISIILIGLIGAIGETENKSLKSNMAAICVAGVFGFVMATWYL